MFGEDGRPKQSKTMAPGIGRIKTQAHESELGEMLTGSERNRNDLEDLG